MKKNFFFTLMGRNRITFLTEMLLFFVVSNSVKLTCILYFAAWALTKKCVLGTLLREKDKLPKKNLIDRLSHIHQRVMCATNHLKVEHFVSNGYIHKYVLSTNYQIKLS